MTTSQAAREEQKAFVQARLTAFELGHLLVKAKDPQEAIAIQTEYLKGQMAAMEEQDKAASGMIQSEMGAAAPDDDLAAEEWELAKAAVLKAASDRLDKPDDFLAYVRAKISNI
jgi:hypothetical protein